jgi:hypothetical protein
VVQSLNKADKLARKGAYRELGELITLDESKKAIPSQQGG